jgi:tRNA(Ile)-lysidine synthase
MTTLQAKFQIIINQIFANKLPRKVAVAVSGGCDSMALLLLLNNLFGKKIQVFCLTINHCTQKSSAQYSQFVANFCQKNFINCQILKSYLLKPPSVNIESTLRDVRYKLLQDYCCQNNIKHLFVAHHHQDLAENFLIRLFRGSGIDGLAAMDYQSKLGTMNLIRPLIDFTKEDLRQYLIAKNVNWIEDQSNKDEKYLRNKIRNFINSLEEKELINKRIILASRAILEAKKIITKATTKNFPKVFQFNNLGYFIFDIKKFCELEKHIATRYLGLSLIKISGNIYKPRLEKLQKLYEVIFANKLNKSQTFYGCALEKLNDKEILIYREKSVIKDIELLTIKTKFDNRFLIKTTKDLIDQNIIISTLSPAQFNQITKNNATLKQLKNPLKKIFYTIPAFKIDNKIISIPQINYYLQYGSKNKIINKINIVYS